MVVGHKYPITHMMITAISESLAPLIRAAILFLVPSLAAPLSGRSRLACPSTSYSKSNALGIVFLEPFVRSIPIGKTL